MLTGRECGVLVLLAALLCPPGVPRAGSASPSLAAPRASPVSLLASLVEFGEDLPSRQGHTAKKTDWAVIATAPGTGFHVEILLGPIHDEVGRKLAVTVTGTARSPPIHPA